MKKPEYFYRPKQVLRRLSKFLTSKTNSTEVRLLWGHQNFSINPQETIGKSILHFGLYDLALSEAMFRLLKPESLCVDVGANIGYFSSLMGHHGGETYCFEPHPQVFEKLKQNCSQLEDVYLFPKALSDQEGTSTLHVPTGFSKNEGIASMNPIEDSEKVSIETTTLDSQFPSQTIDILKIDVEGHEISVLCGAEKALGQGRIKNILFEDFQGPSSDVIGKLVDLDYKVYRLKKGFSNLELISPTDGAKIPLWEPPNYLATKDPITWSEPPGWTLLKL